MRARQLILAFAASRLVIPKIAAKMNRSVLALMFLFVLSSVGFLYGVIGQTPDMENNYDKIRVGMPQDEVNAIFSHAKRGPVFGDMAGWIHIYCDPHCGTPFAGPDVAVTFTSSGLVSHAECGPTCLAAS